MTGYKLNPRDVHLAATGDRTKSLLPSPNLKLDFRQWAACPFQWLPDHAFAIAAIVSPSSSMERHHALRNDEGCAGAASWDSGLKRPHRSLEIYPTRIAMCSRGNALSPERLSSKSESLRFVWTTSPVRLRCFVDRWAHERSIGSTIRIEFQFSRPSCWSCCQRRSPEYVLQTLGTWLYDSDGSRSGDEIYGIVIMSSKMLKLSCCVSSLYACYVVRGSRKAVSRMSSAKVSARRRRCK